MWIDLLREKKDKAFLETGADEVLALLKQVDPKSIDAPPAAALQAEIEKGQREAAEAEAALQKQLAQARAAARSDPSTISGSGAPASETKPASDVSAMAGSPDDKQPRQGMSASELEQKFGRCFEPKSDAMVGGAMGGKVWALKDLGKCRELFKDFVGRSVLVFDGKVDSIRPNAELAPKKLKLVDGKLVPADEKDLQPPAPTPQAAPQASAPSYVAPQPIAPPEPGAVPATSLPISTQP